MAAVTTRLGPPPRSIGLTNRCAPRVLQNVALVAIPHSSESHVLLGRLSSPRVACAEAVQLLIVGSSDAESMLEPSPAHI